MIQENKSMRFVENSEKILHFLSDLWFNILMGQKMKLGSKVNIETKSGDILIIKTSGVGRYGEKK
ncbi:MAG: hypothetical protein ACC630_01065 [Nitrospinota bacterium]